MRHVVLSSALPPYERLFPYYAELCALSELRKKPGFGVPIYSGIGGHSLLYLNGVRIDHGAGGYPRLELCPPHAAPEQAGVGISVNSHYRNANWVAFEGRDFVFRGGLPRGVALTHEAYQQVQAQAQARNVLGAIDFHEHFFRNKPASMSREAFKYEISVATDYAACFGRDVYRARVPLSLAQMELVIAYLNALNEPFRTGRATYQWRLFNDNCAHVAHNALAQAGVWSPWPTGQWAVRAAFRFPVPKNEMVDLALRANDLPLEDPVALFKDRAARDCLLTHGCLPTRPGALTSTAFAITENAVYDTRKLRLIFYDNPCWGPYRFRFKRIFTMPHYRRLKANLRYFAQRYQVAATPHPAHRARLPDEFMTRYEQHIATQIDFLTTCLAGQEDTRA